MGISKRNVLPSGWTVPEHYLQAIQNDLHIFSLSVTISEQRKDNTNAQILIKWQATTTTRQLPGSYGYPSLQLLFRWFMNSFVT